MVSKRLEKLVLALSCCLITHGDQDSENLTNTITPPTAERLSCKIVQAWVSMVLHLKR